MKELNALFSELKSSDFFIRKEAVRQIEMLETNKELVDLLIQSLSDKDWHVKKHAAILLGKFEVTEAITGLTALLDDVDEEVRRVCVETLGSLNAIESAPQLFTRFSDTDEDVRSSVITAFQRMDAEKSVRFLITQFTDKQYKVRHSAVDILTMLHGSWPVAGLLMGLANEYDDDVQEICFSSLSKCVKSGHVLTVLNSVKSMPLNRYIIKLLTIIEKPQPFRICLKTSETVKLVLQKVDKNILVELCINFLKDDDIHIRQFVANVLGETCDLSGVEPLINSLADKNMLVREFSAGALRKLGDVRAVPALIDSLKYENKHLQVAVINALAGLGDSSAIVSLVDLLKKGGDISAISFALQKLGNESTTLPLLEVISNDGQLADLDNYTIGNVISAIGELGNSSVVESLIPFLDYYSEKLIDEDDDDATVRFTAAYALGNVGDIRASGPIFNAYLREDISDDVFKEVLIQLDKKNENYFLNEIKTRGCHVAAEVLGILGHKEAVEPLINIIQDSDGNICYEAVVALGKIGDTRAVIPLIEVLENDNCFSPLVEALGMLGDKRAVDPLIILLEYDYALEENDEFKSNGLQESMVYDESIQDYQREYEYNYECSYCTKYKKEEILESTVVALGKLGDIRALEPLGNLPYTYNYSDEKTQRFYVKKAIDRIKELNA